MVRKQGRQSGQAMIESLIVVVVIVGLFFFFFDFTFSIITREVLAYGASKVARADAVGYNTFQREKALRIGLMPISGTRLVPEDTPFEDLRSHVRTYLQTETWSEALGVLDYERWETLRLETERQHAMTRSKVSMEFPITFPEKLARMFHEDASGISQKVRRSATWEIENHASLYLESGEVAR